MKIKNRILLFTLLTFGVQGFMVFAQKTLPIPPKNEKTTHFSIPFFDRQPVAPVYIQEGIKKLETTSRSSWSLQDSLFYAYELSYLGDYDKALAYFNKLNTDTLSTTTSNRLYQLALRKTNRFDKLIASIEKQMQDAPELEAINKTRIHLIEQRKKQLSDPKRIERLTLFPELSDTVYLDQSPLNEIVAIAERYDQALREDVLFTDENDKILSKAYEEYGDFLHRYLYVSNAYRAYSIARNFDKRNKAASDKIKLVKAELNDNNFLYPSMFNYFKRINTAKYTFETYKELDSLHYQNKIEGDYPELDELLAQSDIRKDYLPWLDLEIAIIITLGLLLLIVILLIKSK
jgi:hypothetical protein